MWHPCAQPVMWMPYLQQAAAKAVLLIADTPVVQICPHHAQDGAPLVVADGVEE